MVETIEKQTYKVREAAKILGVPLTTLYQAIKDERFPAIHVGNAVRISRAVIQRALDGEYQMTRSGQERMAPQNVVRARQAEDPDEWAERQAHELEIRTRVKGGELY